LWARYPCTPPDPLVPQGMHPLFPGMPVNVTIFLPWFPDVEKDLIDPACATQRVSGKGGRYEDLGPLGQDETALGWCWFHCSNVIPRRARPGLAGLGPGRRAPPP
jgi:hypothetical protein